MGDYPKEFIEELRLQLGRHIESQNSLNTKTNALLVVSGITASIVFGFYGDIANNNNISIYNIEDLTSDDFKYTIAAFFTIIFISGSIILALLVFRPMNTTYPITSSNYFSKDGKPSIEKIKERCEINIGKIELTVLGYLITMRKIEEQNKEISSKLQFGIVLYICGISTWIVFTILIAIF